jgi:hypothetical protein
MTLTVTKPSRPRARNAGARAGASHIAATSAAGIRFLHGHFHGRISGALRRRSTSSACRVDSRPADIARRLPRARCAKAGFARDARAPHVGETYTLSNVGANVLQGKACAPRRSQSGRPRKRGANHGTSLGHITAKGGPRSRRELQAFVHALALRFGLAGFVWNDSGDVTIEIEGRRSESQDLADRSLVHASPVESRARRPGSARRRAVVLWLGFLLGGSMDDDATRVWLLPPGR